VRNRILDISQEGAGLSVKHSNLEIRPASSEETRLPLGDIAVLILAHPAIHITQAVLAGIGGAGGIVLTCDSARLPSAMQIPMVGHHVQGERVAAQAAASIPTRKRVWKQIVRAKIVHQAQVLDDLRGVDMGLLNLVSKVRSGDPDNLEATAARRYWQALFEGAGFRRSREIPDVNRYLNYGYAVLRALVARAICSAGLLPSLGLHHHNKYDPFPLADDLMEPWRPLVDHAAWHMNDQHGPDAPLGPELKSALVAPLLRRYRFESEDRTLFDILSRVAASLAATLMGERKDLLLPNFRSNCAKPVAASGPNQ